MTFFDLEEYDPSRTGHYSTDSYDLYKMCRIYDFIKSLYIHIDLVSFDSLEQGPTVNRMVETSGSAPLFDFIREVGCSQNSSQILFFETPERISEPTIGLDSYRIEP